VEVYYPNTAAVEKMVREKGMNLFYESVAHRRLCCSVRKVEPLMRALDGLDAWITGLRREQSVTRTEVKKVEIDEAHGNRVKINPLADWSNEQVWNYVKKNNVAFNPLYNKGYTSIGCEPCTRPIKPGEDVRAGRWWWESPDQKECGLHVHK
jgi:phosphoadenosine phosphosulfate reductase